MTPVNLTVPDPALQEMSLTVQELRQSMRQLYLQLVEQATVHVLTPAEWVATMILTRATECLQSIELLVAFGRDRDAAVLILVILELDYDLQYIRLDTTRANQWLSHSNEGRKPWSVTHLLQALHPDLADREAAQATYKQLSMVKHGNPASGTEGFPLGKHGRMLHARLSQHPDLLMAYLFSAAGSCAGIVDAAVACFATIEPSISALVGAVHSTSSRITRQMEERMVEILRSIRGATEA